MPARAEALELTSTAAWGVGTAHCWRGQYMQGLSPWARLVLLCGYRYFTQGEGFHLQKLKGTPSMLGYTAEARGLGSSGLAV